LPLRHRSIAASGRYRISEDQLVRKKLISEFSILINRAASGGKQVKILLDSGWQFDDHEKSSRHRLKDGVVDVGQPTIEFKQRIM
jgi:hypothetical protein